MIDFIGRRKIFLVISLAMLIPCLVALALWQLRPGIDFVGGLEIEVEFIQKPEPQEILDVINEFDVSNPEVEPTDRGSYLLRIPIAEDQEGQTLADDLGARLDERFGGFRVEDFTLQPDLLTSEVLFSLPTTQETVRDALATAGHSDARVQGTAENSFKIRVQEPERGTLEDLRKAIQTALETQIGPLFVRQSASVSGVLSSQIARDAGIAVGVAALALLVYISLAFRRLPKPLLYGSAAVVALLHDVIVVVGIFAILGEAVDLEVNAMFVTALLAIIGYSVNDTIVVFDRYRENLAEDRGDLRTGINAAITETLARSLNTSFTIVVALLALLLIGGVTIRPFILALLIGTVTGTYSSIAVASQIVVLWEEGSIQRWVFFWRGWRGEEAPA